MDIKVKGISWVGNVYQKFETMCLEVEDVVCQETAKYVETQVKTVGSSVKKFYSEVLQDLLPPSPRSEESGFSLEQNAVFGTNVKPDILIEEESGNKDSDKGQEQIHEVENGKTSMMVSDNNPINTRLHPIELSDVTTSPGIKSQISLHGRVQKENHLLPSLSFNSDKAGDLRSHVVQPDNDEICGKFNSPTETDFTDPPLPDVLELDSAAGKGTSGASSPRNILIDRNIISSTSHKTIGTTFTERVFDSVCAAHSSSSFLSSLVLPVEAHECKAVENGLSAFNVTSNESNEKSVYSSGMDECKEIVELESVNMFETAKLEESCIVVDSKEIPFLTPRASKHRSYKKKIRDALAARARSAHKQEYEQLAIRHEDANNQPKTNSSSLSLLSRNLESRDDESEWELL